MRSINFYRAGNRSGGRLRINTGGATVDLNVGLTDVQGRPVIRVDVQPEGPHPRGGDINGNLRQRERWRGPYALWSRRAAQDCIDLVTGEHYSASTHYGHDIPSAAQARELSAALACYLWS